MYLHFSKSCVYINWTAAVIFCSNIAAVWYTRECKRHILLFRNFSGLCTYKSCMIYCTNEDFQLQSALCKERQRHEIYSNTQSKHTNLYIFANDKIFRLTASRFFPREKQENNKIERKVCKRKRECKRQKSKINLWLSDLLYSNYK